MLQAESWWLAKLLIPSTRNFLFQAEYRNEILQAEINSFLCRIFYKNVWPGTLSQTLRHDEVLKKIIRLKDGVFLMLGTFPKAFSQAATSKGIFPSGNFPNVQFPKRQLPKVVFPSGNFPNVQFPKRQLPKFVLAAVLGPLSHPSRSARPPL